MRASANVADSILSRVHWFPVIVAVFLIGSAQPVTGQGMRVHVVDAENSIPVAGALVLLLGPDGKDQGRAVTTEAGTVQLRVPVSGVYRLRLLRIGHSAWESPTVEMRGEPRDVEFRVPSQRVVLPDIVVLGMSLCGARTADDAATAALWDEARKAFDLARETVLHRRLRFQSVEQVYDLDREGKVVRELLAKEPSGLTAWPVRAPPIESLAVYGFVIHLEDLGDGPTWFGPDPEVLLSELFLESHCFRTVPAPAESPSSWVGPGFEPAPAPHKPDIRGTIWVDQSTAELRRLDFAYETLPSWAGHAQAGGRLEFARLAGGVWIVQRWRLRVPVPEVQLGSERARLHGYQETRGRIESVMSERGDVLARFAP